MTGVLSFLIKICITYGTDWLGEIGKSGFDVDGTRGQVVRDLSGREEAG
jgi:hypothetical protein